MEPYWDLIKRIITESDLVMEILDARLVELSRNEEVERLVEEINRPIIFVVNKSDLVSRESIKRQIEKLRKKGEVVYISAKQKSSRKIMYYIIKKVFKQHGKRAPIILERYDKKPEHREARADIVVGVLGYPNTGKSSIINLLAHKQKMKVSRKAGTTHGIHWIKATDEIKLIDSPGVIPLKKDDELRYGLIGARDSEKLHNPEIVAIAIIKLFLRNNKMAFESFYGIEIKSEEPSEILSYLAEQKSHLAKAGNLDIYRTSSMIVRDWQQGKLRI